MRTHSSLGSSSLSNTSNKCSWLFSIGKWKVSGWQSAVMDDGGGGWPGETAAGEQLSVAAKAVG